MYNQTMRNLNYKKMAGKVTISTVVVGIAVFILTFLFDTGQKEFSKVIAQTATTTLTVLNTPPVFVQGAYELYESSTTTPTNSGTEIVWQAIGSDSNGAPYFLLICDSNVPPIANAASDPNNLGTAPPDCGAGAVKWGVSTGTVSNTVAVVSTTTTEVSPFTEVNNWYAWVCDDDPVYPSCNSTPVQGLSATNSSPFHVNRRPVFSGFSNDGPVDPGGILLFSSTSTDPDTVGGSDNIYLIVCNSNTDYSTTTNTCTNDFIASTTISMTDNATATYTVPSIIRDNTYPAYGYLVDEHGHEAANNPINVNFDVNNVPPVVLGGDIILNGGNDITSLLPGVESNPASTTLNFTVRDANSCLTAASSSEIVSYKVSIFRSSYGTTTCDGTAGSYNPNYCYPSGVATSTWNLNCVQTNVCASPTQDNIDYSCTFPLWFLADPTDSGPNTPAAFANDTWSAAVAAIDDDNATSSFATTSSPVELISLSALGIVNSDIAYGAIAPGNNTGSLSATSTLENIGNTGIDQEVIGDSMCGTYSPSNKCPNSATSTIPENKQQFASSSVSYGSLLALSLSSTTPKELELNVNKTTSTSTPQQAITYWGIEVPISITLSGNYQGMNTFTAVTAEPADW